jgi:hypothetical protein
MFVKPLTLLSFRPNLVDHTQVRDLPAVYHCHQLQSSLLNQAQSQTIKPPTPTTRPAHMPTPNPILKLSAPLWPPLEPDPVADGTLCDGEEEEEKGVSARMLVAAAGVKPEKVSEMPRKESVVDAVTLTLRIRQGGLSCVLRGTCVMNGGSYQRQQTNLLRTPR